MKGGDQICIRIHIYICINLIVDVIFENHVGPDKIIWGRSDSLRRNLVRGVELHPEERR